VTEIGQMKSVIEQWNRAGIMDFCFLRDKATKTANNQL